MENETLDHLFINCPFSISMWANSKWQLRLDKINPRNIIAFIFELCSRTNAFSVPLDIRHECLNFAAVEMERIWRLRNQIFLGEEVLTWEKSFEFINRLTHTSMWLYQERRNGRP